MSRELLQSHAVSKCNILHFSVPQVERITNCVQSTRSSSTIFYVVLRYTGDELTKEMVTLIDRKTPASWMQTIAL